jgi:hypothetical protein
MHLSCAVHPNRRSIDRKFSSSLTSGGSFGPDPDDSAPPGTPHEAPPFSTSTPQTSWNVDVSIRVDNQEIGTNIDCQIAKGLVDQLTHD